MPKVSVVVPVYDVEKYLPKCVDSILNQTEDDFELILVDDGSPGKSGEMCDEYAEKDSRVRVIHQQNKGLGGARNTGIEAAKSDWILFVDSDDFIQPETLGKTLELGEKKDADMVVFGFQSVNENNQILNVFRDDHFIDEKTGEFAAINLSQRKELLLCAPVAWNKLYRTKLFLETGIRYPEKVWYEDIRTTLKILLHCEKIIYTNYILYNYLMRQGSITKNINADRNVEIKYAFEDIFSYFKENNKFEEYYAELEYLTIYHVFIAATDRVLLIDKKHSLIGDFRGFLTSNFPNYKNNKYLYRLTKNEKIIYGLLNKKLYGIVRFIFSVKGALSK